MLIPKFETGPTEYLPFERIAFLPCTFVKIFILIGYGGFCKNTNVLTSESIMKWDLKKKMKIIKLSTILPTFIPNQNNFVTNNYTQILSQILKGRRYTKGIGQ